MNTLEDSDSDDKFVKFQVHCRKREREISPVESVPRSAPTDTQKYSMAQIEIQELQEEVADLKQSMCPKPSAQKSENRKVV